MFEQRRSDAKRMILISDHNRDISSGRVSGDRIVRYTNEPAPIESAQSVLPNRRLDELANELLEMGWMQREEAEVPIMIAEVLMKCDNGFGVIGVKATQRDQSSV
jgi:hypothetical protein